MQPPTFSTGHFLCRLTGLNLGRPFIWALECLYYYNSRMFSSWHPFSIASTQSLKIWETATMWRISEYELCTYVHCIMLEPVLAWISFTESAPFRPCQPILTCLSSSVSFFSWLHQTINSMRDETTQSVWFTGLSLYISYAWCNIWHIEDTQ